MVAAKTRCKKCVHADKVANQAPCSMCQEIYPYLREFENAFLMASKKRVRVIKTNGN